MKTLADVHPVTATLPPRLLIHGKEGTGKTSLAAQFPSVIFLQTEDGTPGGRELASFGPLEDLNSVRDAIAALGNEAHGFRTLALDSVSALEPLIWAAVCREQGWSSIEDGNYGRGYIAADGVWRDLLAGFDWLRRRGMIILLIAHSAVETITDPRAPAYTSFQVRLHKRARALLQDWCDAVGFLSVDIVTKSRRRRLRPQARARRWRLSTLPAFRAAAGLHRKEPLPPSGQDAGPSGFRLCRQVGTAPPAGCAGRNGSPPRS